NLSKSLKNDSAYANFSEILGFINFNEHRYTLAIKNFREAFQIRKKLKQYPEMLNSLINIGQMHEKQGEYSKAQDVYFDALKAADKFKLENFKAKSNYHLGSLYVLMGHYIPAANYLNKSRNLYLQSNDDDGIGNALNGLGSVFKMQHNFDSAEHYYKQAIQAHQKTGNNTNLSLALNNLAALYTENEMYNKALEYYEKTADLYKSLPVQEGTAIALLNLGVCYHDMGQFKKALAYFFQADEISKKLQIPHITTMVYYNISSAYEELGDLKPALKYAQMYSDLQDTLFTKEGHRHIAEMRQKYEAEKSEQEISKLQTEKALQQSELTVRTQQRNMILLTAAIILVFAGFVAFSFRQKLHLNKIKAQQAEEKNMQALNNLLKEQEIKAISAMIKGQEQERQRIAEDLHDRLGSLLSTVKLNFSGLEKKANIALADSDQYRKGIFLLDEACTEVRKIAHNMASGVLQKYGYLTAVNELKSSIESSNQVKVNLYSHNTDIPVDKETEINLYRITQELVSNILKHAAATEINIQYTIIENTINLIVEDNGRGFNYQEKQNVKGMGISNVFARVSKLEGNINFDSSAGRGTSVIINVPLKVTTLTTSLNFLIL
ncbi:MAG: tetratricopeptide repeat-containing sensor histidine kinase, partial [Bacteroidia bacterium]